MHDVDVRVGPNSELTWMSRQLNLTRALSFSGSARHFGVILDNGMDMRVHVNYYVFVFRADHGYIRIIGKMGHLLAQSMAE